MPASSSSRPRRPLPAVIGGCALVLGFGSALAQDAPPSEPTPPPARPEEPAPDRPDEPRETIVTLRDGRRVSGVFVRQDAGSVVITINGIETRFPQTDVARVQVLPTVSEQYESLRAALDEKDAEGRLRLADWLRSRERFDLALREIEVVLSQDPANPQALELRTLVTEQAALRARAALAPRPPQAAPQGDSDAPVKPRKLTFPLLTEDQINLIRVYETDLSSPPRMLIGRGTIRRLIELHAADPLLPSTAEGREDLYRRSPAEILDLMFQVRARDLYAEVRVLDDPKPLRTFRDQVHRTWLINSCATAQCHGGSDAGRLRLAARRPNSDAAVYTNFLILERYRTADGASLIDYDRPTDSPLLQVGLPRADSRRPHPETPGIRGTTWKPVFRSTDDDRFKQALEWISGLYRPRPEYPVVYEPPGPSLPPPPAEAPTSPER